MDYYPKFKCENLPPLHWSDQSFGIIFDKKRIINLMAQAGAHAIVGMYASRLPFFNKKWTPAIIIGSLIPDLDIIAVAVGKLFTSIPEPIHYFHRKGTHSLLFVLFIFLIFEILSEILKNPKLRNWGKGLSIGITTQIIMDSFLFLQSILLQVRITLLF